MYPIDAKTAEPISMKLGTVIKYTSGSVLSYETFTSDFSFTNYDVIIKFCSKINVLPHRLPEHGSASEVMLGIEAFTRAKPE